MAQANSAKRVSFARDRVVAEKLSDSGELLIRAGVVRNIEYKVESKEIRLQCDNALIIIDIDEIVEYEALKNETIAIRCRNYSLNITGKDAAIEIGEIITVLTSYIASKQKKEKPAPKKEATTHDAYGYYATLGVESGCSQDEIKKAYKKKCLKVHPDVNKSSGAHEAFLALQKAYEVLGDAQKRSKYDAQNISVPSPGSDQSKKTENEDSKFEPIRCSRCHCVTAQPRYVVFWETFSFFSTIRSPVQGVMCAKCAGDAAYQATKKSLIFGWWGIWGLIMTPMSVLTNLSGGEKPPENNGRLLLHQSWYFAQNNKPELAYLLAKQASSYLRYCAENDTGKLLSICHIIMDKCKEYGSGKSLADAWSKSLPRIGDQWKAIGICGIAWSISIGFLNLYLVEQGRKARVGAPEYSYKTPEVKNDLPPPAPSQHDNKFAPAISPMPPKELPIPPTYLPLNTGYLPGKEKNDTSGNSEITLKNNSDINFHVKLYRRLQGKWQLSRELYLKSYEEFTMGDLESGEYEIRRMDVQTKNASKTDSFALEERNDSNGVTYSVLTITLNAIQGNSKITPIPAKDF